MTVSLGQILVLVLVCLLLFGNFPNILRDIASTIKNLTNSHSKGGDSDGNEHIQEKRDSNP